MNMADIAPPGLSYNYPLDSIEIMYGWEDNYYLTTFDTFVEKIDHINPQVNIDLGDITTVDGLMVVCYMWTIREDDHPDVFQKLRTIFRTIVEEQA